MKHLLIISSILIAIIVITAFLFSYPILSQNTEQKPFYVGVAFCGNTTTEAKLLIDRVKTYTNLLSSPIRSREQ